jgi:hypothetical protein
MTAHKILGGKVSVYKRPTGEHWHCAASVNGKQFRVSTKEVGLPEAKEVAEDWYLSLRAKARAGVLKTEKTFEEAAEQFLKEYEIITEGQRSPAWVKGHGIRLRLHLLPFFGDLALSDITAGKVQEYRVERMTQAKSKPNTKANGGANDKPGHCLRLCMERHDNESRRWVGVFLERPHNDQVRVVRSDKANKFDGFSGFNQRRRRYDES